MQRAIIILESESESERESENERETALRSGIKREYSIKIKHTEGSTLYGNVENILHPALDCILKPGRNIQHTMFSKNHYSRLNGN